MTRVHRGGEMDAFTPSDSSVYEATLALYGGGIPFTAPYARCAIVVGTSGAYAEANYTSLTTFWMRFDLFSPRNVQNPFTILSLYSSVGVEVFRLVVTDGPDPTSVIPQTLTAYSWSGSAFAQVGASFVYTTNVVNTFNLNLVAATGAFALYLNGTLRASGTGTAFTNIAKTRLKSPGGTGLTYWSQVIHGDESEIGNFLYRLPIDTAGTNTAWTGGPSDINELVYSDATFNSSATNGDIETDTCSVLDLSAYTIQDVGLSARANCGASGPQNLQLATRSGGTNYFSASVLQSAGYAVSQHGWATNPNTSAQWTPSGVQAGEYGFKAVT